MRFARYYQISHDNLGGNALVQAMGSDSIVYLEADLTMKGCHNVCIDHAARLNRKDGLNKRYAGYAIFHGEGLLQATPKFTEIFPTSVEFIEVCRGQKVII